MLSLTRYRKQLFALLTGLSLSPSLSPAAEPIERMPKAASGADLKKEGITSTAEILDKGYVEAALKDQGFKDALSFIMEREKGINKDSKDRGNQLIRLKNGKTRRTVTKDGITQDTYNAFRKGLKRPVRDVQRCTDDERTRIYHEMFYKEAGCDRLAPKVGKTLFNISVNCSPQTAVRILRRCLGVRESSVVDQDCLEAAKSQCSKENGETLLAYDLTVKLLKRYTDLAGKDQRQLKFFCGWLLRTYDLQDDLALSSSATSTAKDLRSVLEQVYCTEKKILKEGSQGPGIEALNRLLGRNDGGVSFDSETKERVIKDIQIPTSNRPEDWDGVFGIKTLHALFKLKLQDPTSS